MAKAVLNSNLLSETLIPLSKARKQFPGREVSPSCLERWIRNGSHGAILEICRIGNTRYTSEEAIQRFLEAMNQSDPEKPSFRRMSEKEIEQKKRVLGIEF